MNYRHLGRTGVKVSPLCLGTMNFGVQADEAASFAIMDQALELGINFFDTANVYGWQLGEGITEKMIGRWLAQGGGRREKIVLATKVNGKMGSGPNDERLSAYHIRRACEDSLRRLQTDHIDLYIMHHVDRATPWEEIWQAMEQLVREGKITYVGSSSFAGWHIALAQCTAIGRHMMGLVAEQSIYSLAERKIEMEVIPACRHLGIGLTCWSPLRGGVLAGVLEKIKKGTMVRGSDHWGGPFLAIKQNRDRVEAYESLCREIGEPPAVVGLAWLLQRPVVTAPIIGPRTAEQLSGSMRALAVTLADDVLARLNEIWPGPGAEAPEAYHGFY